MKGPFTVDPPSPRDSRPAHCYDVLDGDMEPVVPNLTFNTAKHVADSLNLAERERGEE
jgi:hypothetical protein